MRLVLTAGLALALSSAAFAEEAAKSVESRIAHVTVYEDRALVTRLSKATLTQGVSRIAFERLPPGLDDASLRARCGAARVLGVDRETVHLAREGREEMQKAVAAHAAAKRKLTAAEMELTEAKDRWELFRSIRAKGTEGAERALGGGGAVDVGSLRKLIEMVGEEGAAARKAVLAATSAVEDAKAEEQAAAQREAELATGRDRTETRVVVTLDAAAAGDADVSLQYLVADASWRPVYDLRVGEDFGDASLGLSAMVAQRSGEDWKDVAIELTTAQPSAGAAPPEPQPWTIYLPHPRGDGAAGPPAAFAAKPGAPAKRKGDAEVDADEVRSGLVLMETKDAAFAPMVRATGLVVAFEAQVAASIASDGQPSRVSLARYDLKPDVRWVAFPRVTDKVFVTAKMTNTTASALPAGECRVFVGADFVGPMQLKDWGTGKEVDVGLGVDRQVEAEREKLSDERSTTGVFSKATVHARGFRITVRNQRDRAIDVRLLDQVPVSNDEELTVKLTETSTPLAQLPPRDAETNKARGILEWRFPLAPKASQDVRFAFEVEHPRSKDVSGLGE